jgi:hypothetical protein
MIYSRLDSSWQRSTFGVGRFAYHSPSRSLSDVSPVATLEPKKRNLLLNELGLVADQRFGGWVERPFITVMYAARRL